MLGSLESSFQTASKYSEHQRFNQHTRERFLFFFFWKTIPDLSRNNKEIVKFTIFSIFEKSVSVRLIGKLFQKNFLLLADGIARLSRKGGETLKFLISSIFDKI